MSTLTGMRYLGLRSVAAVSLLLSGLALSANQLLHRESQASGQPRESESQSKLVELVPVASRHEYGVYGFSDVAILDDGEMWAVGYDGQDPRRMWRSTDGGYAWQRIPLQTAGFTLKAIRFFDNQYGWAVGGYGTIMVTIDGGKKWKQSRRSTRADLQKVSFANARLGYVASSIGTYDRDTDTSTYGIEILRTSDGGKTWQRCYKDRTSGTVWELVTLSETTAFVLLDGNRLLRTTDGGMRWHEVLFKLRGPQSIAFAKNGIGWMVGEKLFYRSSDAGLTWRIPDDLPCNLLQHDWWSIDFADEKIGMAVSEDCVIAVTYDGGLSWTEAKSNMHEGNTIWYNEGIGFKENLRGVRLHGSSGVILGSQRLLLVKAFGDQN